MIIERASQNKQHPPGPNHLLAPFFVALDRPMQGQRRKWHNSCTTQAGELGARRAPKCKLERNFALAYT